MSAGNVVPPVFSLALSRGKDSILTFGDTAPVPRRGEVIRVPFSELNGPSEDRQRYPVQADGLHINDVFIPTSYEYFVDSGAPAMYLPREYADKIAKACEPPAQYNVVFGLYQVPCNAVVPKVGLRFGGKTFYMDPQDLIDQNGDSCELRILRSGGASRLRVAMIGRPFLQNVIADFHTEKRELWFTERG